MTKFLLFLQLLLLSTACETILGNDDLQIAYFPDSEVIKQSIAYKNGKKNGYMKLFYPNGNPKAIQKFINDTITDTSFLFRESGILSEYQIFNKGVKTGCWKKFNKSGQEFWSTCFKEGVFHGPAKELSYRTLKPVLSYNFSNGKKEGRQENYHDNGKLKSVSYFKDGFICEGTEEWSKNGEKIDNDFRITVTEKNEVLLKNKLSLLVTPENIQPDDIAYEIAAPGNNKNLSTIRRLIREHNHFVLEYSIGQGSFVMEKVHFAVFRKTAFGNTFIKKTSFMVSANHFN